MVEFSIREWCGYLQAPQPTKRAAKDKIGRFMKVSSKAANFIGRAVQEGYEKVNYDKSIPMQHAVWCALVETISELRSPREKERQGLDAVVFPMKDNRSRVIEVRKRDMYPRSPKDPRWNKPTDGVWQGLRGMRRILEARETVSSTSRWTDAEEAMYENGKRPLLREQTLSLLEQAGIYDEVPHTPKEFIKFFGSVQQRYQAATDKKEVALLEAVVKALESDRALFRYERSIAAVYRDDRGYELFRFPLH